MKFGGRCHPAASKTFLLLGSKKKVNKQKLSYPHLRRAYVKMALVGYSDSEASSQDEKPKLAASKSAKPGSSRLIDRSNPHRIRVNLPESSIVTAVEDENQHDEERPAKKAKISGGGFNAMLPAPKRTIAKSAARSSGLGAGVSLKTNAQAGFSREDPQEKMNTEGEAVEQLTDTAETERPPMEQEEPKMVGNAMVFKPLSVARKPQKKKKQIAEGAAYASATQATGTQASMKTGLKQPPLKPKISLFGTSSLGEAILDGDARRGASAPSHGEYQPMIHNFTGTKTDADSIDKSTNPAEIASQEQSGSTLTSSLDLPPSALRQLFGRSAKSPENINLTTFNVSTEYAHNESLRQSGELENHRHNPVRAIAAGKHSLTQLVNQVTNQREALEERFSEGKARKKEGGSKYGW